MLVIITLVLYVFLIKEIFRFRYIINLSENKTIEKKYFTLIILNILAIFLFLLINLSSFNIIRLGSDINKYLFYLTALILLIKFFLLLKAKNLVLTYISEVNKKAEEKLKEEEKPKE